MIDKVEELTKMRALEAFHLSPNNWCVNVQTLSGSLANLCLFNAILNVGDTVLALGTRSSGGHHTYGFNNNLYSKAWNTVHYEVNENYHIDFNEVRKKAEEHKPKLIIAGASTYP